MTDRRWTSLCWTALALALLAALPAVAAPASSPPSAADLATSYAAIFARQAPAPAPAPAPAAPAERAVTPVPETGLTLVVCCSYTYCCEIMESSECDGTRFGSLYTCANRCSLC